MVGRHAILGLAALLLVAGCHAGSPGGLKRPDPPLAMDTISKARIIAQHNKNAAAIKSLKATPSIVFAAGDQQGKLSGRLAMARERDFRLEISSTLHKQADIGSNSKGFWFWVNEKQDKAIYVCDYDRVNASPLAVTMQPDWILEAMGLREISEREAATISASKGDKPGQLVLTQLRNDPKGGALTKVTVVDESSGEILEHRLYSGAKEKLLAKATISQTQGIKMLDDPEGLVVNFPARIKLDWIVENFSLDITMGEPRINPEFAKEARALLFNEPKISGAVRTDLAKLGNAPASASSRIYESAPRSGIRLGKPEIDPISVDGALTPAGGSQSSADVPDLPSRAIGYVGPKIPRGVDSEAVAPSGSVILGRGTFNR